MHAFCVSYFVASRSLAFWVGNGTWKWNQYQKHGKMQYRENRLFFFKQLWLHLCDSAFWQSVYLDWEIASFRQLKLKSSQLSLTCVYILKDRQLELLFIIRMRSHKDKKQYFKADDHCAGRKAWFWSRVPQSHSMLCNWYWHQPLKTPMEFTAIL